MKTKRLIWMLGLALLAALLISGAVFAEGGESPESSPSETDLAPPSEEPVSQESSAGDPAPIEEASVPGDTQSGEGALADDPLAAEEPAAGAEESESGAAEADAGAADTAPAEVPEDGAESEPSSAELDEPGSPEELADPYYYVEGILRRQWHPGRD